MRRAILLIGSLLLFVALTESGSGASVEDSVLLSDDFEDGNDSGWTLTGGEEGTWQVIEGVYEGRILGIQKNSRKSAGSILWRNYSLSLDLKGVAGIDKGIYFRHSDTRNFCSINIRPMINDVVLVRLDNGTKVIEQSYPFVSTNGVWYHVEIDVQDSVYVCSIDSQQVFSFTDNFTSRDFGQVSIELYSAGQSESRTQFDNIVVRCISGSTCAYFYGDPDGNGQVSVSDAVYLINFIFAAGPTPVPLMSGDADCTGSITISDAVYLINYIFGGGPAPCEP